MDTTGLYRLRIEAVERAERILERHEAELVAKEQLLERALATGMQPCQDDWQQRVEAALSGVRKCDDIYRSNSISGGGVLTTTAVLKEWEDLLSRLEKHAAQWRRKDAEITAREQDVAQREAALEKERHWLLQERQRLTKSEEALSAMRVAVEQRTRGLNIRESELSARHGRGVEDEENHKAARIILQERETQLALDRERCNRLLEALCELYGRLALLV
ncbi:hypothetical protein TraAM80_06913 [Trypanosoma rangeli]|uniref:Uncharacterized protein n=1 Tax=Trypanosoma rangeli TaxID=5698 RepID=A0A3R7LQP2_TRYRA|nr:uncharacterized protein TraAM80_06913 [Trypanosoma rangeli]RNF01542.1 hypothetical protein TraAM80_06913 [Trypanosoma rangeli]|eukprot:RNF01542.1 hypothetical protein TraAM80_06913 [Trypanosoma rangeli]